jgi:hypothetical protein
MAGKTSIPSVMLSQADGGFLLSALDHLASFPQLSPRVVIDLQSFPALFDSETMGHGPHQGHPSIRSSDTVIHVLGQGLWSVVITRIEGGGEWQLFIVKTLELQELVPWTVLSSPDEQPLSTLPSFLPNHEPVSLYRQLLSQQCPADVEWDQSRDQVLLHLTSHRPCD